jgi:cytochrome P450
MVAASSHGAVPDAWPLVGHFPAYARDPLGFATAAAASGGVADVRFGPLPALLVSDASSIEEVLVGRHRDFVKGRANQRVGVVVGQGILLSEGETWRRHRRIVQPAFQHDRIAAWGPLMMDETRIALDGWRSSEVRDVSAAMSALALAIVGRTVLDSTIDDADVANVQAAAATLTDHFDSRFNTLAFFVPDWLPTPGNRRMRAAVGRLDAIVYRLIAERRQSGSRGDDVISMLLDAEGGSETTGAGLSDREIRDEVMTLFMAGHETTAVALAWTIDLLARAPDVQATLAAELGAVLGDRPLTVDDLPALPYAEAVVNEALRLYPPAYALSREAVVPTTIGGAHLPAHGIAFVSLWAAHRRSMVFEEPDAFRPQRWLDGLARRLPRGAYAPFAAGPRKCIGAGFAMQEMLLAVAGIVRDWELHPVGAERPRTRPAITLRPAGPMPVRIVRRTGARTSAAG